VSACFSGGDSTIFGSASVGAGPQVQWDLDHKPLPEIPLPNDIATRVDPTSPTGKRINVSFEAATELEAKMRRRFADLDGFGTFSPITIAFNERIDLTRIAARQKADTQFDDDVVLLIDVTPGSPDYGQAQILDFGNGFFPMTVGDVADYWEHDPRDESSNIVFETYDERMLGDGDDHCDIWEDINQNGQLDAGEDIDGDGRLDIAEDTDADGVCDVPNVWGEFLGDPSRYDAYHDLITFYELETDTLLIRPITALRERTTYAVVLTKDLVGMQGTPIRSPFENTYHLQQANALKPLFEDGVLENLGHSANDVAFAWAFTTQSVTHTLKTIREGLYGIGPLAHLSDSYPAKIDDIVAISSEPTGSPYLVYANEITDTLSTIFEFVDLGYDRTRVDPLIDTYGAIGHVVAGDLTSPDFIDAGGGVFDVNPVTGVATHEPNSLRFLLAVPDERFGSQPFPTVVYSHGYTSNKVEALAFAGVLAKFGIATFVIDSYDHGLPLGPLVNSVVEEILASFEEDGKDLTPFWNAIQKDRAKDLNGDGILQPGGNFWTHDPFHTRDSVRQSVADNLQVIRILRSFDGEKTWPFDLNGDGIFGEIAGDFDGNGIVDVAGPDANLYTMGTSMGGIVSSILGALDPAISVAAPISPGGGLTDVGARTKLGTVQRSVLLPLMGPFVVSDPQGSNPELTSLSWLVNDANYKDEHTFARVGRYDENGNLVEEMRPGDLFRVENLRNGKISQIVVTANRRTRLPIAADKGDPVVVTIWRPTLDAEPPTGLGCEALKGSAHLADCIDTFQTDVLFQTKTHEFGDPLVAIQEGFGYKRGTPEFRRLVGLAQNVLDGSDPISFMRYYSEPLEVLPEGDLPKSLHITLTLGDMTVPIASGFSLARAAGILGYKEPDRRYGVTQNQLLIDKHVVEAIDERHYFEGDCCHAFCGRANFDIDDLSNGMHPDKPPRLSEIVPTNGCGGPVEVCSATCAPLPPLRAVAPTEHGINVLRIPTLKIRGQHAIDLPDPRLDFDPSMFVLNQIGLYLQSGGRELSDHPCLARNDCRDCTGDDCPTMPAPPSKDDIIPRR